MPQNSEAVARLRRKADDRLGGLRVMRYSWWVHWQRLAELYLPRRYKWVITPNQASRGSPINQFIIDNTGTLAARTLSVGLMGGLTNPMTPWFKFHIRGMEDPSSDVVLWLSECTKRMLHVFQESNFYNALSTMYMDLVVFGTAAFIIYEDYEDVIHCYNPCLGEFFVDDSYKLENTVFYREYTRTIAQVVEEFGIENCSAGVKKMYETGGAGLTREIIIRHMIEPNTEPSPVPQLFQYREMYWENGSSNDEVLRLRGYRDRCQIVVRWDTVSNDPYGRSQGMDAEGDVAQLQQETRRKAQAIDKMVNPPLKADIQLKNQPASLLPGGITYVSGFGRDRPGLETIYTVLPPINEMKEDIKEIQARIRYTFFNYLFTSVTDLQTVRSAEEIIARKEEKLIMINAIKRLDREALQPAINRTWGVMLRAGLFPPIPEDARGRLVEIKYTSPFAQAMLAAETTAIERSYQFAAGIIAIDPNAADNYNVDRTIQIYNEDLGADPRILNTDQERGERRQERIDQQHAAQMQQQLLAGVQGANVLSQTDVGGGQNALQKVLGGQGGQG